MGFYLLVVIVFLFLFSFPVLSLLFSVFVVTPSFSLEVRGLWGFRLFRTVICCHIAVIAVADDEVFVAFHHMFVSITQTFEHLPELLVGDTVVLHTVVL